MKGFISYPRTETDKFKPEAEDELRALVHAQRASAPWGAYAAALLDGGGFAFPRAGPHDDEAHPPIAPMRAASGPQDVGGAEEWRVYVSERESFPSSSSMSSSSSRARSPRFGDEAAF